MCLILFAVDADDDFPFILAANRDEFYNRPTRPMGFWQKRSDLLAGKDMEAGGTWFGVSKSGRFAALTNYRDLSQIKSHAPSRGEIIPNILDSSTPIPEYLNILDRDADQYSGFNLLVGESLGSVYWYSNQNSIITRVSPGIHGLSNHLLDTDWPKVNLGKKGLRKIIESNSMDDKAMFDLLSNTLSPDDQLLPDTGVGMVWERILAPLFIRSDTYGTRSSTLVRISRTGEIRVTERTWGLSPDKNQDRRFALNRYPSII